MNKYYYKQNNGGCLGPIICVALAIALILGLNSCTAKTWNNGVCAICEVRYELRGVSRGMKYYACPECGQEVHRY